MAVRNEGGQDVDYDVQPSDPGPGPSPLTGEARDASRNAMLFTAMGASFTGFGCLTGFGDQAFVLAGLGLLVVGLVFQGLAVDRTRRLALGGESRLAIASTGRIHLPNGTEHRRTFEKGNWVEFWDHGDATRLLAKSPVISDPSARVVLRRCVSADRAALGSEVLPGDLGYHVEVTEATT